MTRHKLMPDRTAFVFPEMDDPRPALGLHKHLRQGENLPSHSHVRGQLFAMRQGSMAVITKDRAYVLPPHRALWIPPGEEHACSHLEQAQMRTLYLDQSLSCRLPARTTMVTLSGLLNELIETVLNLSSDPDRVHEVARLIEVIIDQFRGNIGHALSLKMPSSPKVRMVAEAMMKRENSELPLEHLARLAGFSLRSLERKFKQETGLTLRGYRSQVRIMWAIELLTMGNSITETSIMLNYENPSSFTHAFKKSVGVAPREFVKTSLC